MSDHKADDGTQRPAADPADAAARLAALLAKPLEPVVRSYGQPQDWRREPPVAPRDIPPAHTAPWKAPADPAESARGAEPSPALETDASAVTREHEPVEEAASLVQPSEPASDVEPIADVEPVSDLEPASDETTSAPHAAREGPSEDPMAKLVAAMTKLVEEEIRHSGPRPPPEEPGPQLGELAGSAEPVALAQEPVALADPAMAVHAPDPAEATPDPAPRWTWFRRRAQPTSPDGEVSTPHAVFHDGGTLRLDQFVPEPTPAEPPVGPAEPGETLREPVAEPATTPLRPSVRPASETVAEQTGADEPPLDPAAARIISRVRRLMLISSLTTVIGIGAILGVIGYRVYKAADVVPPPPAPVVVPGPAPPPPAAPTEVTLSLPQGARIIQTAVAEDRLVITLDIAGAIEIRTYDLKTLQPLARLSFGEVP
jgi:hypothetical protein